MVRTEPSAADRHLIRVLARIGLKLSPYQLERWRTAGLIPHTSMRSGNTKAHTSATAVLVAGLAVCAPLCRTKEDLALLAFFNEVPVPPDDVREALAKVYFPQHAEAREQEYVHLQRIPAENRGEHGLEYAWAEAAADSDMEEYKTAVRQMRENLATASRAELDGRLRGVLIWLNMPALPVHNSEFMADLRAAMAFSGPPESSRAAWLLAAVCHSQSTNKIHFRNRPKGVAEGRPILQKGLRRRRQDGGNRRTIGQLTLPWVARSRRDRRSATPFTRRGDVVGKQLTHGVPPCLRWRRSS
jgi:hypothetical protein